MQISANAQAIAYLVSAVLFILSLKGLTHPSSARRGNYLGMAGMADRDRRDAARWRGAVVRLHHRRRASSVA